MKLIHHDAPIPMVSFSSPETLFPFEVSVRLEEDQLRLEYFVSDMWCGSFEALPPRFERHHGLWEQSCLELFWGKLKTPAYWEFNFSLDGCWNCYRFSKYRGGLAEEAAAALVRFASRPKGAGWVFEISATLPAAALSECAFSPSAVWLVPETGEKHFFAPAHRGDKPDFHRRTARRFVICSEAKRT